MLRIPLDSTRERYSLTVTLDGVEVAMRVYWLERAAGWYVDLETPAGAVLASTVRITPGAPLAIPGAAVGLPPGTFLASGPDYYTRNDLGTQVTLDYVTAAEVAQIAAA